MQTPVYDEDKTDSEAPGQHENLGVSDEQRQQEVSQLEDSFNAPATEEKQSSGFYTPSSSLSTDYIAGFRLNKKKGYGIAGIVIGLVMGFMGLAYIQGPLQFIHFAQMLQQFHFSDQSNNADSRLKRLIIYVNTKDVSKTRLGFLASHYAGTIDASLAKNGWKLEFDNFGKFTGFTYDPAADAKAQGADPAQAKENMRQSLINDGLDPKLIDASGNNIKITPDGAKYWKGRSMLKQVFKVGTDVGSVTSAAQKRVLIKRIGWSLNPITKLDNAIKGTVQDKLKKIIEERKAKLSATETPDKPHATSKQAESNATKAQQADATTAQNVTDGANQMVDDAASGKGLDAGKITAGKVAGGFGAVLGLMCMVNGVFGNVMHAKVVAAQAPMMQASAEILGVGSKSQDGRDTQIEALSAYDTSLTSNTKTNKSTWMNGSSLQWQIGNQNTGTKLPPELSPTPQLNELEKALQQLSGPLSDACKPLENKYVGWALNALGTVTAPVMTALQNALLPSAINEITSLLSPTTVDLTNPAYAGAVFGEATNVGSRLAADEAAFSTGGSIMSDTQELTLNEQTNQAKIQNDKTRSIADKYLNPYEYDTAVAKMIDNTQINDSLASMAKLPLSLFGTVLKPFSSMAHAVGGESPSAAYYGIPKVGFTAAEFATAEDPYANASNAANLIASDSTYTDLLKKCNHVLVTKDSQGNLDFTTESGTISDPVITGDYSKVPSDCKEPNADATTEQKNHWQNFISVRVAVFDTMTMKSYACVNLNDDQSCQDLGLTTSGSTSTTADSSTSSAGAQTWTWPLGGNISINSCFAQPLSNGPHPGLDLQAAMNTPVLAAADGTVYGDPGGSYGIIEIKHVMPDGSIIYSVYEHMSSFSVKNGDTVKAGQQIGLSGNTAPPGGSTGPHLHFGITKNPSAFGYADMGKGVLINPLVYVNNGQSYKQCDINPRKD